MAGLGITRSKRLAAFYAGLLLSAVVCSVYIALSLTDLWGYLSPVIQVIVYGLLLVVMAISVTGGLAGKKIWSLPIGLKAFGLSVVLLVIAVILAGPDAARLLEIAMKPRAVFSYPVPEITMTVTPPSYSDRKEFTENIAAGQDHAPDVTPIVEGSEVRLRVSNTDYAPTLVAGHQRIEFLTGKGGGFVARFTLKNQSEWQIREGSRLISRWPIVMLADEAPVISRADFHNMMTGDGLFGLTLDISDDYGLQDVVVGVEAPGAKSNNLHDRTTPGIHGVKKFSGDIYVNFSASDFAGQKVDLVVEATDQAGQTSRKIISGITLPERVFANGLSRQLVSIRDGIITQPDRRKDLVRQLMALGLVPPDGHLPSIFYIALRSAYWRLTNSEGDSDLASARDILWNLAERLEDGGRGQFERDILADLLSLKLILSRRQDLSTLRKQLQQIDRTLIRFRQKRAASLDVRYPPEKYDIRALRKIYSKILSFSFYKKTGQAMDLVSYLEHGFIYNDRTILSGQGFARFQTADHARKTVNILKKAQKQVMGFVLKRTVRLDFASAETTNDLRVARNRDMQNWITIQQQLGEKLGNLGRTLQKSGIDAARFTVPARDLMGEVVGSMKDGDMSAAAGYQNQIITLLQSLKNMLAQELRYRPKAMKKTD